MWNLKKKVQMNLQNRNSFTDIESKLMVTKREENRRDKLGTWD